MNVDELDPGIRETVRTMVANGFQTTDSGDGVSKLDLIASGDALPFPHVFCVADKDGMFAEADRLAALLGDEWAVEATYSPNDGLCILLASKA